MASRMQARLDKLEAQRNAQTETGQRVERFTVDGEEYVQIYWNAQPSGKPMRAWMWDAWPDPGEMEVTA